MGHHFSKTTLFTILFVLLGFGLTGAIIYTHLDLSPDLPVDIVTISEDAVQDTIRFEHRAKVLYDSLHVGVNPRVERTEVLDAANFYFHYNPDFLVWIILITVMMGLAFGFMPQLLDRLYSLKSRFGNDRKTLLLLTLAVIGVGALLSVGEIFSVYLYAYTDWVEKLHILFTKSWVLRYVILVPTITGLIGLLGMFLISKNVGRLRINESNVDLFRDNFKVLNQSLKFFLAIITVLITFTVFTTAAMRKAILQEVVVSGFEMVPIEFVYLYGLQFTITLAIFYLPIYFQLRAKGQDFVRRYRHDHQNTEKNEHIDLFLKESIMDNLKVAFSILASLLGSVVPDLLSF